MPRRIVVIGGGISGLSAAWSIMRTAPDVEVLVFERDEFPGGTARSIWFGETLVETGPNGFLTSSPAAVNLARDLGFADTLVAASDEAKRRFIAKDTGLVEFPASPGAFFGFPYLNASEKFRAFQEPFLRNRTDVDESVFDFVSRRFGSGIAREFSQLATSGITAGDAKYTSFSAVFPKLAQLEARHGSILLGFRALSSERKKNGGSKPTLMTPKRGMGTFCEVLSQALGPRLHCGVDVVEVERTADGFVVQTAGGASVPCSAVICATPAPIMARLFGKISPDLRDLGSSIASVGVRVTTLGFSASDFEYVPQGFGFLVSSAVDTPLLGCVYSSSVFPHTAAKGKVALRVISGGYRSSTFPTCADDTANEEILGRLRSWLGTKAEPEFMHHTRWASAIPQYGIGHSEKLAPLDNTPGVFICGNAFRGISFNECIETGAAVSARAVQWTRERSL